LAPKVVRRFALVRNPTFAKSSATDRQNLYETFVTLGALIVLFNNAGKTDPTSAKLATSTLQIATPKPN
jgi:hypothetical protein